MYNIFLIESKGIFCEDFDVHFAGFESISLHWVSDCGLKTQNK